MILALALTLAADLLPPLPEGWRFERLDFPLSFAPELDYRGFEELAFATGMFDASSDSYFSYALAIRLEGQHDVDEPFLESFLVTYYRGLCKAVAAEKEPALDLSKVSADVERDGDRFLARVSAFDPFTTMEPLALTIRLRVHASLEGTELFGIASPKADDASVWKDLGALAVAWQARRPPAVFLNHLFVVPDEETFAAIAGSDFLRGAFAVFEERETKRNDMSYRGVYFYGEHTYFEFLPPGAGPGFDAGRTGLAFGVEAAGATDSIGERLRKRRVRSFPADTTRRVGDEDLPWFRILGVESPRAESTISIFSIEYDPGFLEGFHPDLPPSGGGITRRAVLARYAASLDRDPDDALFLDIRTVRLALAAPERQRLFDCCRAFGYSIDEVEGGWACAGPGIRLEVQGSDEPGGVVGFDVALRRPVEREPLRLGTATVRFEGSTAHFDLSL